MVGHVAEHRGGRMACILAGMGERAGRLPYVWHGQRTCGVPRTETQGAGRAGARMTIHDVDQRSYEWFALRAGRLTGSCAADMLATLKGKAEAAARRDLRLRLVC